MRFLSESQTYRNPSWSVVTPIGLFSFPSPFLNSLATPRGCISPSLNLRKLHLPNEVMKAPDVRNTDRGWFNFPATYIDMIMVHVDAPWVRQFTWSTATHTKCSQICSILGKHLDSIIVTICNIHTTSRVKVSALSAGLVVSAPDPNQPQRGSLPVSRVILFAIRAGVVWVWDRDYRACCKLYANLCTCTK